ncbi:MAG: Unknown protein [uncultured Sulfurovum sp.]|uniref:Uncharacterized protein n=1 Tax=uncultured Sulfurovum sp. TaxID=269237 RepID=A0A6S6SS34_9BACT|nr:MAG: Unknown protein [uncultured Sulfurovum sp.]
MQQSVVLKHLIERLRSRGLIKFNKDFLEYIGISHELVSPTQLSGFIKRDGSIQNKLFIKKIETYFQFPDSIWTTTDERQMHLIETAIAHKLYLQSLPGEDALDISSVILTELPCNDNQLNALDNFIKLTSKIQEEEMIDTFLSEGLLEKKLENQEFLVRLLKHTYDKGLYGIIVEFILPNLYRKYHNITEVQKMEAHSYGSLGDYDSAQHILSILIDNNTIENINLKTSSLSNRKRELLQSNKDIHKEDLFLLVRGYQELHAIKGIYSYYTGINLLYMVVLGQILFPEDERFTTVNRQEIYELSKESLSNDDTHNVYYVTMSNFEFQILTGRQGVVKKVESFLANEEPHVSLVERTLRQMKLFISAISNSNNHIVSLFEACIKLLESYIELKTS